MPINLLKYFLTFFSVLFLLNNIVFSQTAGWTASPFDQKVFIENKGQFEIQMNNVEGEIMANPEYSGLTMILFGASCEGVELYFTSKGLTYKHDEMMPMTVRPNGRTSSFSGEEEIKKELAIGHKYSGTKEEEKYEEEKRMMKSIPHYLSIEWVGANPDVEIITEEPVSFYYTYGCEEKNASTTIKANAYKKIIYKNLYQNIDVEYVFPSDSNGIKYSLILHPGANPSVIKMKYEDASTISLDADGNIVIKSSFGEFVDHAPLSFYVDKPERLIPSAFIISNNIVSFQINEFDTTRTIVIDPWTVVPNLPGANEVYDVGRDGAGNIYVYGGSGPFSVQKFTSAGTLVWTFNAPFAGSINWWFGDMVVDAVGNAYICQGYKSSGAGRIKLDPSGVILWNTSSAPNKMNELWALALNCNGNVLIGGGYPIVALGLPAVIENIDVNTGSTINNVNMNLSVNQELRSLCIDSAGDIFGLNSKLFTANIPSSFIRATGGFTQMYDIPSGYPINESGPSYGPMQQGFNGVTADYNFVFTTDGATLDKRNKTTGAVIVTAVIPAGVSEGSAGIAVDSCGNIYVGSQNAVHKYDNNLIWLNSATTPGKVYAVAVNINNEIVAGGNGFVASLNLNSCNPPSCNLCAVNITTSTSISCLNNNSTATATVSGGTPFYTYSWSNGQTTSTATGLSAGIYTVTVIDSSGCNNTQTVTVVSSGSITATAGPDSIICAGGTATLTASGGSAYSWSNGQTTVSITISPTVTTTFSVIVSSGACSDTGFATVTVNSGLTVIAGSNVTVCTGTAVTLSASGGSSYSWSNGQTISSITVNPTATATYTVIGTDANGCTGVDSVIVVITPSIIANAGADVTICQGENVTLNASGGTGYSWIPSTWLSSSTSSNPSASPTGTTTYTVVVTSGSCTPASDLVTIFVNPNPIAGAASNTTITQGQTATLIASGGSAYSWSNGTNGSSITVTPAVTTMYCVTVTDLPAQAGAKNCTDTACVTVTIEPIDCSTTGELYLPNAFSPNDDGENDVLQVFYGNMACIKTFQLVIYDRWGEKVFETSAPAFKWAGNYDSASITTGKDKAMNSAVFVYHLKVTLRNGNEIIRKGNVSLLK